MIDPRLLRDDPDAIRESLARRGAKVDLDALISLEAGLRGSPPAGRGAPGQAEGIGAGDSGSRRSAKEEAISGGGRSRHPGERGGCRRSTVWSRSSTRPSSRSPIWWRPMPPRASAKRTAWRSSGWVSLSTEGTDHATLGESLGIIDTVRAAKVSGSRFGYLKGKGAMLEFSLVRWAMDHLVAEGFTPMVPPVLVREEALVGTGFFPEAREQVYEIPRDELFLVGTCRGPPRCLSHRRDPGIERSAIAVRRFLDMFPKGGRDLREGHGRDLQGPPVRQGRDVRVHHTRRVSCGARSSPCGRGEAGRGAGPPLSGGECRRGGSRRIGGQEVRHRGLVPRGAGLPRDHLVFQYHRLPGATAQDQDEGRDRGIEVLHTLNGTACAVGRTILAILENHQQPDGSVVDSRGAPSLHRVSTSSSRE